MRGQSQRLRGGALLTTLALAAGSLLASGGLAASPAAAVPGVPEPGSTIYVEDFQNAAPTGATTISAYTSATGASYTASPTYLDPALCNGTVYSRQSTDTALRAIGFCRGAESWYPSARTIPAGIGMYNGMADPSANLAVAEQTVGGPVNYAGTMLQGSGIPMVGQGRFVTFSLDVGNLCNVGLQALDRFYLLDGATSIPLNTTDYNVCADPNRRTFAVDSATVTVGTFTGSRAALVHSSSIGFRIDNVQPSGNGNDQAFDNFRILDVTPQLDKSFSPAAVKTGETSTLTFTVTNTSELAAKDGWSFTDTLPNGLTIAAGTPATTTCPTGSVTAPAGGNTITATGNLTNGMAACTISVTVTSEAPNRYENGPSNVTTVGLNPPAVASVVFSDPVISLTKRAAAPVDVNGNGITDAGDTIAYTFDVINDGDVPLASISVNDPKAGAVTCPETELAVGGSQTCTAEPYVVTQADAAAGAVVNTATASGTSPYGAEVTSAPSSTSTPAAVPAPALALVKSATPSEAAAYRVGQEIAYAFVVTNTGNVPLINVSVDESEFSGTGELSAIECPRSTLPVGEEMVCAASYTLTQADADAGQLTNAAIATGASIGGGDPVTTPPSRVTIPSTPAPAISLTKSADVDTVDSAGDVISYRFLVRNTGNVTLTDPTVDETAFSGTGAAPVVSCPTGVSLVPGQSVTCSASYAVTLADLDAGDPITNTATASATPPGMTPAPVSEPSTVTVTPTARPSLDVVKSAQPATPAEFVAGAEVTYSFVVTNTGNVTLADVAIVEGEFTGTGTLPTPTCPVGAASLAPGAQVTCSTVYTVTQADIDAGEITNSATAEGIPPGDDTPVPSEPSTVTVPQPADPALTLVKTTDTAEVTRAGQVVEYAFRVTNNGNTTLTDFTVTEGEFSGTGQLTAVTCPDDAAGVVPGQYLDCHATYTVTAADLTGAPLTNTATATATPPAGAPITSAPSTVEIPTVTASSTGGLPATGGTVAWTAAGLAGLLLLIGAAAVLIHRRRSRATPGAQVR